MDASATGDPSLGKNFHQLAGLLKGGMRLSEALERTKGFMPQPILGCIKTGERIGDLSKVLQACRYLTSDAISSVRAALNYLILVLFVVSPLSVYVPLVLRIKILPAFRQLIPGILEGGDLPPFSQFILDHSMTLICVQLALIFSLWLLAILYLSDSGPRWFSRSFLDSISWRIPWRRKRMCRDFSTLLAVLLDSQVPEAEAVPLAAESVGNLELRKRADSVSRELQEGMALPTALAQLDQRGEMRWRLANALRGRGGFLRALAGWHDALDAKAFQQEQAAAQIASASLVLFNGFIVACFVTALFGALVHVINMATLW
jgi:type II secretory pathway component PulF